MASSATVRPATGKRLPRGGKRRERGRKAASTSAAIAVRSQRASTIPTEPMTRTATAEPTCMDSAMTTTSSAAVPAPRRVEGGPAGSSASG